MIVFELLSCLLNLGQFLVPYPPFSVYGFCLTLFASMTCTLTPFFTSNNDFIEKRLLHDEHEELKELQRIKIIYPFSNGCRK